MIKKLMNAMKKRAVRKTAMAELYAMSDRDLADLGIKRDDIAYIQF